jgi:hypothetical protein
MPESLFGPIIATQNVENAVIATYRVWINEYLAEVERQSGLRRKTLPRPPAPESIHGGVDFESWFQDTTPQVMVVVEPNDALEYGESSGYVQGYDVRVGCLWVGSGSELAQRPEDEARAVVSYYGAALMLLVQTGPLSTLAESLPFERLRMTQAPQTSLPDPDRRQIAQSVVTFELWVAEVIKESAGPVQPNPKESPQYGGEPEAPYGEEPVVSKETIEITAVPLEDQP